MKWIPVNREVSGNDAADLYTRQAVDEHTLSRERERISMSRRCREGDNMWQRDRLERAGRARCSGCLGHDMHQGQLRKTTKAVTTCFFQLTRRACYDGREVGMDGLGVLVVHEQGVSF